MKEQYTRMEEDDIDIRWININNERNGNERSLSRLE